MGQRKIDEATVLNIIQLYKTAKMLDGSQTDERIANIITDAINKIQ